MAETEIIPARQAERELERIIEAAIGPYLCKQRPFLARGIARAIRDAERERECAKTRERGRNDL